MTSGVSVWTLIKNTWMHAHSSVGCVDYIHGIQALVTAMRSDIVSRARPADVTRKVQMALDNLKNNQATFTQSDVAQAAVDAAISSVQGLCDYLAGKVEQPKTSQTDNRASGS
ncbi:hypothetical protein BDR07DRAFT_1429118 [Suillus spraguei]|nr:hypothetical protein BDR07DRAFT_1429118 [Suillus spraguei]